MMQGSGGYQTCVVAGLREEAGCSRWLPLVVYFHLDASRTILLVDRDWKDGSSTEWWEGM